MMLFSWAALVSFTTLVLDKTNAMRNTFAKYAGPRYLHALPTVPEISLPLSMSFPTSAKACSHGTSGKGKRSLKHTGKYNQGKDIKYDRTSRSRRVGTKAPQGGKKLKWTAGSAYCDDYCDQLNDYTSLTANFDVGLTLSILGEPSLTVEALNAFFNSKIGPSLAVCYFDYNGDWRRRLQQDSGSILAIFFDTIYDGAGTCPTDAQTTLAGLCSKFTINTDVMYESGDPAALEDEILNAIVAQCDAIAALENVEATFDPCPYITVEYVGPEEEDDQGGTGVVGGVGSGQSDGADGTDQDTTTDTEDGTESEGDTSQSGDADGTDQDTTTDTEDGTESEGDTSQSGDADGTDQDTTTDTEDGTESEGDTSQSGDADGTDQDTTTGTEDETESEGDTSQSGDADGTDQDTTTGTEDEPDSQGDTSQSGDADGTDQDTTTGTEDGTDSEGDTSQSGDADGTDQETTTGTEDGTDSQGDTTDSENNSGTDGQDGTSGEAGEGTGSDAVEGTGSDSAGGGAGTGGNETGDTQTGGTSDKSVNNTEGTTEEGTVTGDENDGDAATVAGIGEGTVVIAEDDENGRAVAWGIGGILFGLCLFCLLLANRRRQIEEDYRNRKQFVSLDDEYYGDDRDDDDADSHTYEDTSSPGRPGIRSVLDICEDSFADDKEIPTCTPTAPALYTVQKPLGKAQPYQDVHKCASAMCPHCKAANSKTEFVPIARPPPGPPTFPNDAKRHYQADDVISL
ncbi:hypothetical protein ACA910_002563 [Epithemia clementina (nom. ined.)]